MKYLFLLKSHQGNFIPLYAFMRRLTDDVQNEYPALLSDKLKDAVNENIHMMRFISSLFFIFFQEIWKVFFQYMGGPIKTLNIEKISAQKK